MTARKPIQTDETLPDLTPTEPEPASADLFPYSTEPVVVISFVLIWEGVPITFRLTNVPRPMMERQIRSLLTSGYTKPVADRGPSTASQRQDTTATKTVDPVQNGKGDLCCPVHNRILSEGRYGLYCTALTRKGEASNAKGFCSLRFSEVEAQEDLL